MAFEWRWQPIDTRMKDARSIAAADAMKGYVPAEADPSKYVPTPAILATEAMQGYVPAYAGYTMPTPSNEKPQGMLGGEGAIERGRMWGANNYGQGMAYTQNIEAMKQEYAANNARIAQIEARIAELRKSSAGRYAEQDALDLRLAANRANAGDIATALSHYSNIDTRSQQRFNNAVALNGKDADKINNLERDLVQAFQEQAWAQTKEQRAVADYNVGRLQKQYKKLTGAEMPTPFGDGSSGPMTFEDIKIAYTNSLDKKGRPTDEALAKALADSYNVPQTEDVAKWRSEVIKSLTQEKAKSNADIEAEKDLAAFDKFIKENDYTELSYKLRNKAVPADIDGRKLSVYKEPNGDITVKVGKNKKTYKAED